MKNTVLLFGGRSDERLVSVASAQNLARVATFEELMFVFPDGRVTLASAEDLANHANPFTTPFQPKSAVLAPSLREALSRLKGKTVFIGMHGTEGEDGHIQKMFEEGGVFYTGSGSIASANSFSKTKAKEIVGRAGIRLAAELAFENRGSASAIQSELTPFLKAQSKIVVKPTESGSSIGLHIISTEAQLQKASEEIAKSPYKGFLAEAFISGRELTVGVLQTSPQDTPLPPSEAKTQEGHSFDYEGKYLGRGTIEITPAELTLGETQAAQAMALAAHKALGCYGYTRTDMILTPTGPVYLETNTLPGLSKASFIPQQLAAADISVLSFVQMQLELARKR